MFWRFVLVLLLGTAAGVTGASLAEWAGASEGWVLFFNIAPAVICGFFGAMWALSDL